ncbi:MAG TPA: plasmid segregation protein ParM domain-containing protein [Arsenophonus nasoniae]|uniref:plasmid segregation protein ParM domain-containing protein n=1 Tax=Arsenophonus nasoniae TaxID=638 RepID=UPI003879E3C4
MQFFCDDGSSATKLAWYEGEELKTLISENSFSDGWQNADMMTKKAFNYEINGQRFTHKISDKDILKTTNINYQYRIENLLSIQHALQLSGVEPQEIELYVTLPISEFYTKKATKNEININRKISNITQKISLHNGKVFTFKKVHVLPESIPAVTIDLEKDNVKDLELSLVVDLGGTTLDCGLIQGKYDSLVKMTGDSTLGVGQIIDDVRDALIMADTKANFYITDKIIRALVSNDNDTLSYLVISPSKLEPVREILTLASQRIADRVIKHIEENYDGFHRIYLLGGGAEFLFEAIRKHWHQLGSKTKKLVDPQLALVKSIATIKRGTM